MLAIVMPKRPTHAKMIFAIYEFFGEGIPLTLAVAHGERTKNITPKNQNGEEKMISTAERNDILETFHIDTIVVHAVSDGFRDGVSEASCGSEISGHPPPMG